MINLNNLSPEDLLILTNILAVSFSEGKTAIEMDVLGNFFVGIGCLMLTMAAQKEYLNTLQEANNNNNNNNNNDNNSTQPDANNSIGEDDIIG
ncbi:hypothetical protein FHU25_001845 [Clostridium saccharobutylicum]|uniref:hypothetical protein n=1 Tax=Clostridium saccharobutylicum TaxID=169679 RepID=UPI00156DFA97|nr:hypothetical protein [Clostridium saccharobutylicum]NSA17885.1 hypothetical protein [Clostridium saccharobutylicum]